MRICKIKRRAKKAYNLGKKQTENNQYAIETST
jgi:hypothetical protein